MHIVAFGSKQFPTAVCGSAENTPPDWQGGSRLCLVFVQFRQHGNPVSWKVWVNVFLVCLTLAWWRQSRFTTSSTHRRDQEVNTISWVAKTRGKTFLQCTCNRNLRDCLHKTNKKGETNDQILGTASALSGSGFQLFESYGGFHGNDSDMFIRSKPTRNRAVRMILQTWQRHRVPPDHCFCEEVSR